MTIAQHDGLGGAPTEETPTNETPTNETPTNETPTGETPAGETPTNETPTGETPADETPTGETPAGETPAETDTAVEQPVTPVLTTPDVPLNNSGMFSQYGKEGDCIPAQASFISDVELINADGLKGNATNLQTYFENFAKVLEEANTYILTNVNQSPDHCIFGQGYGKSLYDCWEKQCLTFSEFYKNFESWSQAVAVITARSQSTENIVTDIYRTRPTSITNAAGISIKEQQDQNRLAAASTTPYGSGDTAQTAYTYYDENGDLVTVYQDKDGNTFRTDYYNSDGTIKQTVSTDAEGNTATINYKDDGSVNYIIYRDKDGKIIETRPAGFGEDGYLTGDQAKGDYVNPNDTSTTADQGTAIRNEETGAYTGKFDENSFPENAQNTSSDQRDTYADGGYRYQWYDYDNNTWNTVFTDAEGNVIATCISDIEVNDANQTVITGNSEYFDANGNSITLDELRSLQQGYVPPSGENPPVGENPQAGEDPQAGENLSVAPERMSVGQTYTVTSNGIEGQYKYEGSIQRGDMTHEQLFSDAQGNLYYHDGDTMKQVMVSAGGTGSKPATTVDLESISDGELRFQTESGTYTTSVTGGFVSEEGAIINTSGSVQSENGYTVSSMDHTGFTPGQEYSGKGTTLYVPEASLTYGDTDAKELMTTSVIDVRDNLSLEASEMRSYLEINRGSMTTEQISAFETQIASRETIASQMGTDVQFGDGVNDGVIGDYNTFLYSGSAKSTFDKAVERIQSYPEGFTNEDGVAIPGLNSLQSIEDIMGNGQ